MKANNGIKYIFYTVLVIFFLIFRINYIFNNLGITEIEFKSIAIASQGFPFGILKETVLNDYFMPVYYFLIHFFKSELSIRILNSFLALLNILFFVAIGKNLLKGQKGLYLGFLVGLFLSFSHFYLYYTNIIAPYSLTLLTCGAVAYFLIVFLKRPNLKNMKNLSIANCFYIICANLGFLFVLCELIVLYFSFYKHENLKKFIIKLSLHSFIAFLCVFPILIIQYAIWTKLLIPETYGGFGFNLNLFYLMLNEYITPYLSFESSGVETKSTLGMLYSFFMNHSLKNLNSLKIALTLFYSSVLPLVAMIILTLKAYLKNYRLRILITTSFLYLGLILIPMLYEKIDVHPAYGFPVFICIIISTGYGIFLIKDKFIQAIIVFCILMIQFVNPEINAFNITLKKKYPTIDCVNSFIKDYGVTSEDFIIMPFMGNFASKYYKNLVFFDFDYSMLQGKEKKKIIKNIINKKTKTINKNNIRFLTRDYLLENNTNEFITKYFIENCIEKSELDRNIILIVDKMNSKPISENSIIKYANIEQYSPSLKRLDFKNGNLRHSQPKLLFDALKSKTLYNLLNLLVKNFYLKDVIEYKKIDNEYYKIESKNKDIFRAINSYESDYAFIIFKKL